jgi:hypothetical protein
MATVSPHVLSSATWLRRQAKPLLREGHSQPQILSGGAEKSAVFRGAPASSLAEIRGRVHIAAGDDDHVLERRLAVPLDPRLDQHVDRPARHDQMLDIVAADENELTVCIID